MACVRVLIISPTDVGGALAHLAHELRCRGVASARTVAAGREKVGAWARDIVDPLDGGSEARRLLAGAQALHLVDVDPAESSLFGAALEPAAKEMRGGLVQIDRAPKAQWRRLVAAAEERGWPLVTTRADVAVATGAELMAPFVPLWRPPWLPLATGTRMRESVRRPAVVFASSRVPFRRRPSLERLVDAADDMVGPGRQLETVVARTQSQVLRKRRYAHLVLASSDRGKAALALSAFEALAQGVAVVTDTHGDALERYAALGGGTVPVAGVDQLDAAIAGMKARETAAPAMRAWAERALDPARWMSLCVRAYAGTARAA